MIIQNIIILTFSTIIFTLTAACPDLKHHDVRNWSRLKTSQSVQVTNMKNLSSWCTCSSELIDVEVSEIYFFYCDYKKVGDWLSFMAFVLKYNNDNVDGWLV
jgi:hypothetical protein